MGCEARTRTRADRCPGVLRMHEAPDGFLARIRVPGGRLTASQLQTLADAAALGNGVVELTSRANVQVRGLPQDGDGALASLLREGGLFPSAAHDRVRNILASPLAGRHPGSLLDSDPVVDALDGGLCKAPQLAQLPGRFLFAVDDGSGLALGHGADVTLVPDGACAFALLIGDIAVEGRFAGDKAVRLALQAAQAFLAERAGEGSMAWRIRELRDGPARVAARVRLKLGGEHGFAGRGPSALGRLPQRDRLVAITALAPDGRLRPGAISALAQLARAHSLQARVSPWRTIAVPDVAEDACAAVTRGLEECGLVLSGDFQALTGEAQAA